MTPRVVSPLLGETDCDTEDELAQFFESQAEMDGGADEGKDAIPWDGDAHTADRDEGASKQRTRARRISSHGSATDTTEKQGYVVEQRRTAEEQYENATGAHQNGQSLEEQDSHPGVENETTDGRTKTAKRKVATANRNRQSDRKRAREISIGGHHQNQRDLQLIIGEDLSAKVNRSGAVPWEHRGILGHTREGREQERDTMDT